MVLNKFDLRTQNVRNERYFINEKLLYPSIWYFPLIQIFCAMGANVIYLHSVGAQIWAHPNKLCRGQRHLFCVLPPSLSVFVHFVRSKVFHFRGVQLPRADAL